MQAIHVGDPGFDEHDLPRVILGASGLKRDGHQVLGGHHPRGQDGAGAREGSGCSSHLRVNLRAFHQELIHLFPSSLTLRARLWRVYPAGSRSAIFLRLLRHAFHQRFLLGHAGRRLSCGYVRYAVSWVANRYCRFPRDSARRMASNSRLSGSQ